MTWALGPNDEVVDVRREGVYDDWLSRRGLLCMGCMKPVHVFRRQGHIWLRHTSDSTNDDRCSASGTGPESHLHRLLKYWLRDWLRRNGFEATVEKQVGRSRPDVSAIGPGGRRLAWEVQLAELDEEAARRRTDRLLAQGNEVLGRRVLRRLGLSGS